MVEFDFGFVREIVTDKERFYTTDMIRAGDHYMLVIKPGEKMDALIIGAILKMIADFDGKMSK